MTKKTRNIYKDLSKIIKKLQEEKKRILNRLNEINKAIRAVETTLKLIGSRGNGKSVLLAHEELINDLKNRRSELSQLRALIEIADIIGDKNNKFRMVEAKNIMVEAGFFENPKNASAILYTIMERSGKFEKVEPGVYKIIDIEME
ncbi:unnamed protein product [marine sediment metagenome]|uniref:Uncharacterized protein n=1 Tax=marine sediment metagenome TaxID=412755 RepID=X1BTH4_9ZZZZ